MEPQVQPNPGSSNFSLNFNKDFIRIAIESLQNFEKQFDNLMAVRDNSAIMEAAGMLNQISVILQSFSQKLMYAGKPYLVPPHWYANNNDDDFLKLHVRINKLILKHNAEYNRYNYNYGPVLYQSMNMLNILGHRETELRYDLMGLGDIVTPNDVILDIGANCGFMLVYTVFRKGCSGDALDYNPYMLEIGRDVAAYLKVAENIRFLNREFQDFLPDKKYTVIFSFASHWTTDEGLRLTLRDHLKKCADFLTDKGTLVFECQGWEYQKPGYYEALSAANEFFDIVDTKDMKVMGREAYVMKKR